MGLASIAAHKLGGFLPVGAIFKASIRIGQARAKSRNNGPTIAPRASPPNPPLHVWQATEGNFSGPDRPVL
jgi:hypothetical protein